MTIYLPDSLAAEVDAKLSDHNISAICQAALRAELDRVNAHAEVTAQGFERVEVFDRARERDVAFQGRSIGTTDTEEAWLTPRGRIAVYFDPDEVLQVFDDFGSLAAAAEGQQGWSTELIAQAADALGEKYTAELDI